ncbi:hypothetical protein BC936DRAFT_139872 [Jimgerdemannia flammicorona]|uniref:Uncharacterized protein n=1 Tax=Jimgerdemannia flammicorona TaxID=994334 RepID=A0A433B946_9FUNG|nr:hypothetical protein BC936DRAFT_139872 [Jimgerdemannia flammicorona]
MTPSDTFSATSWPMHPTCGISSPSIRQLFTSVALGNMSKDVRRAFELMAQSFGGYACDDQASEYIHKLAEQGQYNKDVLG